MSLADLIEAMADDGAPLAAILKAVRAIEAKDEQIEARRAADRDRKRKQRGKSQDIPVTVTGHGADNPPEVSPNDIYSNPLPNPPEVPEPEGSSTSQRRRTADTYPCPDNVDPDHWRDYLKNRRNREKQMSPTVYKSDLRRLAEWATNEWPPGRIVEKSAEEGWAKLVNPLEYANGKRPNSTGSNRPSGWSAASQAPILGHVGGR